MIQNFIKVENELINPDYIALVELEGEQVIIHMGLAVGTSPQAGTGHVTLHYSLKAWENAIRESKSQLGKTKRLDQ